ncbi:MAG: peptidylprolyl isomerase, partial [Nitrospina sp.]|nr:peptidylprolyl isomerase [Nitrospina sp.]
MTGTGVQAGENAVIETTLGNIELEFFDNKAPGHVKNFKDLAKKGFYDGTTFHRVIPGFMIQG